MFWSCWLKYLPKITLSPLIPGGRLVMHTEISNNYSSAVKISLSPLFQISNDLREIRNQPSVCWCVLAYFSLRNLNQSFPARFMIACSWLLLFNVLRSVKVKCFAVVVVLCFSYGCSEEDFVSDVHCAVCFYRGSQTRHDF